MTPVLQKSILPGSMLVQEERKQPALPWLEGKTPSSKIQKVLYNKVTGDLDPV